MKIASPALPEGFHKPYHPRTIGYSAIKRLLYAILQKSRLQQRQQCAAVNVHNVPTPSVLAQAASDVAYTSTVCSPNVVGASGSTTATSTGAKTQATSAGGKSRHFPHSPNPACLRSLTRHISHMDQPIRRRQRGPIPILRPPCAGTA